MCESSKRINNWTRDELEDAYLRIYDDNVKLKKVFVEQETKMKQMATKLLRIANDKKSFGDSGNLKMYGDEYEQRIYSQQKQITELTNKLHLLQSQKNLSNLKIGSNSSGKITPKTAANIYSVATKPSKNGQDLLNKNAALEMGIRQISEQKLMADRRIAELQDQLTAHHHTWQDQIHQTQVDAATKQRMALQENMALIRVQRELQEKKNNITMSEAQLNQISSSLQATEAANRELISSLERAQCEVKACEETIGLLQTELAIAAGNKRRLVSLETVVSDYQRENDILKRTNENLVSSTINQITPANASTTNASPRQDASIRESHDLREKLCRLENTLESVQRQRRESHAGVSAVQSALQVHSNTVEAENNRLRGQLEEAKKHPVAMATSMQALCQAIGVEIADLETALMILREKKMHAESGGDYSSNLSFLQQKNSNNENSSDLLVKLRKSELEHAETIQELEKTRQLLAVQYRINKEYRAEATQATNRLDALQADYDSQLAEYARLLDIRSARVRRLESQMNSIAYGTKDYIVSKETLGQLESEKTSDLQEDEEVLALERGENLIELHIGQLSLTPEATDSLLVKGASPTQLRVFCVWDFFDFETQSTGLLQGSAGDFNLTVQYAVDMDEFFLQYLHQGRCLVELYQNCHGSFRLLAACRLDLAQLLMGSADLPSVKAGNHQPKRYQAQAEFIGVADFGTKVKRCGANEIQGVPQLVGVRVGRLDYWLRLRVPMPEAIRLYMKRAKALSMLQQNDMTLPGQDPGINNLNIRIVRASGLQSISQDRLPSAYFAYQFYDFPEYVSQVKPASANPIFEDRHTISLRMSKEIDHYLRTSNLLVYIVDDVEMNGSISCMGIAVIPLITLTQTPGVVQGLFELHPPCTVLAKGDRKSEPAGVQVGVIEVDIRWDSSYTMSPMNDLRDVGISSAHKSYQENAENLVVKQPMTNKRNKLTFAADQLTRPIQKVNTSQLFFKSTHHVKPKAISLTATSKPSLNTENTDQPENSDSRPPSTKLMDTEVKALLLSALEEKPEKNSTSSESPEQMVKTKTSIIESANRVPLPSLVNYSKGEQKGEEIENDAELKTLLSFALDDSNPQRARPLLTEKATVLEVPSETVNVAFTKGSPLLSTKTELKENEDDDDDDIVVDDDGDGEGDESSDDNETKHEEQEEGKQKRGEREKEEKIANDEEIKDLLLFARDNSNPKTVASPKTELKNVFAKPIETAYVINKAKGSPLLSTKTNSTEEVEEEEEEEEEEQEKKSENKYVEEKHEDIQKEKIDNNEDIKDLLMFAFDNSNPKSIKTSLTELESASVKPEETANVDVINKSSTRPSPRSRSNASAKEQIVQLRKKSESPTATASQQFRPSARSSLLKCQSSDKKQFNGVDDHSEDNDPLSLAMSEECIDVVTATPDIDLSPTKAPLELMKEAPTPQAKPRSTGREKEANFSKPQVEGTSKSSLIPIASPRSSVASSIRNDSPSTKPTSPQLRELPSRTSKKPVVDDAESVHVTLHRLRLKPNIKSTEGFRAVYVEYTFIGLPELLESETVTAVACCTGRLFKFRFSKDFPVDFTNNYERRQHLANTLLESDPNNGELIFRFVAEPPFSSTKLSSSECIEFAEARVNIRKLYTNKADLINCTIPVFSLASGVAKKQVGEASVTVRCLAALLAIKDEMPDAKLAV